jgi:uncharacterized protein YbcI
MQMNRMATLDRNDGQPPARTTGHGLAQISTGLVQLYSRYGGKGPTKARTHISGDTVVSVFRDPYTVSERTLQDRGRGAVVEQMRDGFHRVVEDEARGIVEEGCGRRVIACLAATHVDPDVFVQIFVLEPELDGNQLAGRPS